MSMVVVAVNAHDFYHTYMFEEPWLAMSSTGMLSKRTAENQT